MITLELTIWGFLKSYYYILGVDLFFSFCYYILTALGGAFCEKQTPLQLYGVIEHQCLLVSVDIKTYLQSAWPNRPLLMGRSALPQTILYN